MDNSFLPAEREGAGCERDGASEEPPRAADAVPMGMVKALQTTEAIAATRATIIIASFMAVV